MSNYSELLKDPRWQKKRKEILKRDSYKCRSCDANKTKMHVHHLNYLSDSNPWEYPNEELITLCGYCHKIVHFLQENNVSLLFVEMVAKCIREQEFKNSNNE